MRDVYKDYPRFVSMAKQLRKYLLVEYERNKMLELMNTKLNIPINGVVNSGSEVMEGVGVL
jgi:hypothetical protein